MIRKASLLACTLSVMVLAHTPDETNSIVRAMLGNALFSLSDNMEANAERDVDESTSTWNGFLGRGEMDGWTQQERKDAFAWYLSDIATNDCTSLSALEEAYVRVAVKKCGVLNFAEAAPHLKAMVLNPKGIYRDMALGIVLRLSPVNDGLTSFAESIMTNTAEYSLEEYGTASCQYAYRLLSFNATNAVQLAYRDNAVGMFYRNRMSDAAATEIVDELFGRYIAGYGTSSNRLAFALNALARSSCVRPDKQYFTSVTNQLLSSGQPLVQLDIGESGD